MQLNIALSRCSDTEMSITAKMNRFKMKIATIVVMMVSSVSNVAFAASNPALIPQTPTLTTLRAIPSALYSQSPVIYLQADTNGSAELYGWSSSSSATDNGTSVIKPNDTSGNGRLLRQISGPNSPVLTPQQFGATCNGTADDTVAFSAMISASAASGFISNVPGTSICMVDTILLPAVGQVLNIEPGAMVKQNFTAAHTLSLLRDGADSQTVQGGGTLDGNFYDNGDSHPFVGMITTLNHNHITIKDITIQNGDGYGIQPGNSNYLTVSHVNIILTWRSAMNATLTANTTAQDLDNIYIDRTARGIGIVDGGLNLHGTDSTHGNFRYSNCIWTNITVLTPTNPTTFTGRVGVEPQYMDNSTFSNIVIIGSAIGWSGGDLTNSSVSNLSVYESSSFGIEIVDNNNVTYSNLTVEGGNNTIRGIVLDGSVSNNNVTGANWNVNDTTTFGIVALGRNTGLSISNPQVNMSAAGSNFAIELQLSLNFSVTGGNINGNGVTQVGIYLDRSWNGQISSVNHSGFTSECELLHDTAAADVFTNITWTGNNFQSCGSAVISTAFTAGATLGSGLVASANNTCMLLTNLMGGCALSWAPTLVGSTSGTATCTKCVGFYKINAEGEVIANFTIITSSTAGLTGTTMMIGGLPYTNDATTDDNGTCTFAQWQGVTMPGSQTQLAGFILPNTFAAFITGSGSGATSVSLAPSAFANATTLLGQCIYHTQ